MVEEGNVHIIYDHNRHNLDLCRFSFENFVQIIYCDRYSYCAQHRLPKGDGPLLISYGVISSCLPSLIRLGTVTLQATTTKHARQVWLSPLCPIDIKLSHRAPAIKCGRGVSNQTFQPKVTASLASLCPQPTCDCRFKEFFDSLTSFSPHLPPPPLTSSLSLPPSSSSSSSLLFSLLSRPD